MPEESSKEIRIDIIDDNIIEPIEFFTFLIDKVSFDSYQIQNNEKIIFIKDNDCKFKII